VAQFSRVHHPSSEDGFDAGVGITKLGFEGMVCSFVHSFESAWLLCKRTFRTDALYCAQFEFVFCDVTCHDALGSWSARYIYTSNCAGRIGVGNWSINCNIVG
jgi:hypothetical protein